MQPRTVIYNKFVLHRLGLVEAGTSSAARGASSFCTLAGVRMRGGGAAAAAAASTAAGGGGK